MEAETWLAVFEKRGLTITDVANVAGVSRSTLSKAVRGLEPRQAGWFVALGRALDLTPGESAALCDAVPASVPGYRMWRARVQ